MREVKERMNCGKRKGEEETIGKRRKLDWKVKERRKEGRGEKGRRGREGRRRKQEKK